MMKSLARVVVRSNQPCNLLPGQVPQSRHYQVPHEVIFDQTKKDNNPNASEDQNAKPQSSEKPESDPMKQPDPQKSPSSSTGIESEGPGGSKAGKGQNIGWTCSLCIRKNAVICISGASQCVCSLDGWMLRLQNINQRKGCGDLFIFSLSNWISLDWSSLEICHEMKMSALSISHLTYHFTQTLYVTIFMLLCLLIVWHSPRLRCTKLWVKQLCITLYDRIALEETLPSDCSITLLADGTLWMAN